MAEKEIKVTEEGLNKIKSELEYLKGTMRMEVAAKIKEARSFGDLSENAEYDAAKNEQAQLEARIQLLEQKIKYAHVISEDDVKTDEVGVGSVVTVWDKGEKEEVKYKIVGTSEVDTLNNYISDESPVGNALIGKKVGDTVTIQTPGENVILEIKSISK